MLVNLGCRSALTFFIGVGSYSLALSNQESLVDDSSNARQTASPLGYSEILCASYKSRMDMALRWREQGFPVAYVEDALFSIDVEDDLRTLRFLRQTLRNIYAEPDTGREYLDEGSFEGDCVKIHCGY